MNKVNVRAFANFAYELGQQTELTRSGWRLIGAVREPLGCHVARAAQIGFILAIMEGRSRDFAQEVATALLFHDLPENRTGDADKVMARYVAIDEKRALEQQVGRVTGKSVRARYSQDATLLGGAVVRVGSTVYDGSILGQLTKLREQFAAS